MADPFIGEIRLFGFGAPILKGWHPCDGAVLEIKQFTALFAVIGNFYGGNGATTFALPDLRGRAAMGFGHGHGQGTKGGEERIELTASSIPSHNHVVQASSVDGNANGPKGNILAAAPIYAGPLGQTEINTQTVSQAGGKAHENMQPWACAQFCIALEGIFPSRD